MREPICLKYRDGARQSERLGSLRYGRMAMCERPFRVRNHLVGRDASYEEALYERSRFVYPFSKNCELPLMLINGEFGTVACAFGCFLYK